MKIAVIGPQFPDSFARNVCVSLGNMGHQVLSFDGLRENMNQSRYLAAFWRYLPRVFPSLDERMYATLFADIERYRPDAVLVTGDIFPPRVVKCLRSAAHAPVLCWYIDAVSNLRGGRIFACPYDAFFCKEQRLAEIMSDKLLMPAFYLPEACNSQWHRPVAPTPEQRALYGCDITAQGTFHFYRAKFFDGLTDFDVKIWGSAAPAYVESPSRRFYQHRFIAEAEKATAFCSAKILVNCINFAEMTGVNNTLFEGAGCGAFQICDDRPTLPEFFKPDEEIVTFRSRSELLDKIRYYLTREDERKKIGDRASQRAHKDHTYEHRLNKMFEMAKLVETSTAAAKAKA